jgi:hypothetical protein
MFGFPVTSWYTDLMTINRVENHKVGNITKQRRVVKAVGVPCRVYKNSNPQSAMKDTAAETTPQDMLACDNSVDIQAGDELLVIRGGGLPNGKNNSPTRYFAGLPSNYYEPFGGVMPGLAHQQVPLSGTTRN